MEQIQPRQPISLDSREAAIVLDDPRTAEDGYGVWYDLKATLRIANFDTSRVGLDDFTLSTVNQSGVNGYILSYTATGNFMEYDGLWYHSTQFLIDKDGTVLGVAQVRLNTNRDSEMTEQRMEKVRELAVRAIWRTRNGSPNKRGGRNIPSGIEDSPIMIKAVNLDLTKPKTFPVAATDRAEPHPERLDVPKAENVVRMISAIENGQTKVNAGYLKAVFSHWFTSTFRRKRAA